MEGLTMAIGSFFSFSSNDSARAFVNVYVFGRFPINAFVHCKFNVNFVRFYVIFHTIDYLRFPKVPLEIPDRKISKFSQHQMASRRFAPQFQHDRNLRMPSTHEPMPKNMIFFNIQ